MTTVFWLLAASMSLVALLFAIVPMLRSTDTAAVSRQVLNAQLIKEQLNELRADLDSGKLDPDAYKAARHDLERELLLDTDSAADSGQQSTHSGRWAAGPVAVAIPALAVFLYLQLGAAPLLDAPAPAQVAQQPTEEKSHALEDMVEQLSRRLQEEPDNAEGWVLLGRSYASMNRYGEAANAYAEARRIAGDHPQLLVDSADIMVMASGGRFTPEAADLLERALQNDASNAKGLWLRGHYRYQKANFQGAVNDWRLAAAQLPPDSKDLEAIQQQIMQAEKRLTAAGGSPAAAPDAAPEAKPDETGQAIQVSVALDPALAEQARPQDTVFVFARAVSGPRMPLAIVRKQVADLPFSVTLDDSLAMSPAMVMSNFSEVAIGARVSRSGNAMAQSGDLEGIVSPVQAGAAVDVLIDQVRP
jgi:cytochrome c-type biogenesis protein CcmH